MEQWRTVAYSGVQWRTVGCSAGQWCTLGTVEVSKMYSEVQCHLQLSDNVNQFLGISVDF